MIAPPKETRKNYKASKATYSHYVAIAIGCMLIIALGLWFRGATKEENQEKTTSNKPKLSILTAHPKVYSRVSTEKPPPAPKPPKHPLKTYVDERGVLRYEGGARVITKPPARIIQLGSGKPPIFEYSSENEIAGLLQIEPGDFLVGDIQYGQRFVDDFLESLRHPIIVSKDDDEETKALKRAVIDTKMEIKERYDAGEDIAKLLTDTRAELQRMGLYRDVLRDELLRLRREEGVTSQDIIDFTEAANMMLAAKGLQPFSMPKKILEHMIKKEVGAK